MFKIKGKYNEASVFANSIDDETTKQILNLCNQEWTSESKIAIMPDTHAGKGCTIGTTMTIGDKVCPNLVGVDIGCGMLTVKIPKDINDFSLKELDDFINLNIPAGFNINEAKKYQEEREKLRLNELKCFESIKNIDSIEKSISSLGGGNHFIEIDIDDEDNKYLVIHTGSRNLGKQVADYYQNLAHEDCNKEKENKKFQQEKIISHYINLGQPQKIEVALKEFNENYKGNINVQKELCYLTGQHKDDYLHDMYICQHFAEVNRKHIALFILVAHLFYQQDRDLTAVISCNDKNQWIYKGAKREIEIEVFETVHNYINPEDNILRKGAISAKDGERVLIPINMRDGAIIGVGKGNPDYNYSGPHGAGRLMSRAQAKEMVSIEEFKESMKDVYSSSVGLSTLDESPMAYKPIEDIIENIKDSIEVVKVIKPIYNFKSH